MKLALIRLVVTIAILSQVAVSQRPQWVRYDSKNSGLPSDRAQAIAVDSTGRTWIGGDFGVTTFDGSKWTTVETGTQATINPVEAIITDRKNNVWVGTNHCLILFCNNGQSRLFFFELFGDNEDYKAGSLMCDNLGNIWVGGLARINIQSVLDSMGPIDFIGNKVRYRSYTLNTLPAQAPRPSTTSSPIIQDESGNIWCGGAMSLGKYDGAKWTRFEFPIAKYGQVLSLCSDGKGGLWVGTLLDGLMKFDGTNWQKVELPNPHFEAGGIQAIARDTSGNIWIGTTWRLLQFDGVNWTVHNTRNVDEPFDGHSPLDPANSINSIAIGSDGRVWVATESGIASYKK